MRRLLLLAAVLASAAPASAGQFRVRAREHWETGRLRQGDGRSQAGYAGFLSAVDLWYERPWQWAFGVAAQRGVKTRIGGPEDRLTMTAVGLEGKVFPTPRARWWFLRGGLLAEALDPAGPRRDFWLYGATAGTGLEFPVWRIGLAPEIGGRVMGGTHGRKDTSFYIALGVHFYVFPNDREASPKDAWEPRFRR